MLSFNYSFEYYKRYSPYVFINLQFTGWQEIILHETLNYKIKYPKTQKVTTIYLYIYLLVYKPLFYTLSLIHGIQNLIYFKFSTKYF